MCFNRIALALIAISFPAWSAAPVVGTPVIVVGNATSASMNTTGATLICASISDGTNDPLGSSVTITDNKSNTWVAAGTTSMAWLKCAYGVGLVVGTGHTITVTGGTGPGGGDTQVAFVAFSGFTGPVDKYAFALHQFAGGSPWTPTYTPASITPSANGELILAGLYGGGAPNSSSGFTSYASQTVGWTIGSGYLVQAMAASVAPVWTWTGGACFCSAYAAAYPAITSHQRSRLFGFGQ